MKMRLWILYIQKIFIIILLIICQQQSITAQETFGRRDYQQGAYWGLSVGPTQSAITYEGIPTNINLTATKKYATLGSLELGYFFSKYVGMSTGLGYVSYRNQYALANYQNEFSTIDSEKEPYTMRVSATNVSENQKIDLLTLPFCLHLRIPFNESIGLFLKTGINLSVPVTKKHISSGTFTYKGYYPAYNVVLENLPELGFPSDKSIRSESKLEINKLYFTTIASVGFDFYVQENIQLAVGANFTKTLLKEAPVSATTPSSPDRFLLSPDASHINSFMKMSNKVTATSVGLEITIRFYL